MREAPSSAVFITAQAASPSPRRRTLWDETQNTALRALKEALVFPSGIYLSRSKKVLSSVLVAKVSIMFRFCMI